MSETLKEIGVQTLVVEGIMFAAGTTAVTFFGLDFAHQTQQIGAQEQIQAQLTEDPHPIMDPLNKERAAQGLEPRTAAGLIGDAILRADNADMLRQDDVILATAPGVVTLGAASYAVWRFRSARRTLRARNARRHPDIGPATTGEPR